MKYWEIKVTILLKKDIIFTSSSEIIGNNINYAMLKDEELKAYHKEKNYKYVFGNFFPPERDGIYKASRVYVFSIRSFNYDFISKIKICLEGYESNDFNIIAMDVREINEQPIEFIETITPAIVTVNGKPWLSSGDILLLVKRIHSNAEKKYKFFFGEEIGHVDDYFIEKLKILNKKPMYYEFKGKRLLGNKFKIKVNEDEKSQKLAFIILGAGLAEKNSALGAGYCIPDWRRI
ncbi:CRISPR-associated endoribonuclease Cas6 [Desnuesiella massiliensis]|uniref:CRISPR-associated endoribonuclease Cas6 n=1 Tax=Desnuesiella massiliensis TaxID=1650662 RepID=UPI0006E1D1E5|nr:CRISPR-associated endoribonuclease Cas6 [Desnuesiella massiliensis]